MNLKIEIEYRDRKVVNQIDDWVITKMDILAELFFENVCSNQPYELLHIDSTISNVLLFFARK